MRTATILAVSVALLCASAAAPAAVTAYYNVDTGHIYMSWWAGDFDCYQILSQKPGKLTGPAVPNWIPGSYTEIDDRPNSFAQFFPSPVGLPADRWDFGEVAAKSIPPGYLSVAYGYGFPGLPQPVIYESGGPPAGGDVPVTLSGTCMADTYARAEVFGVSDEDDPPPDSGATSASSSAYAFVIAEDPPDMYDAMADADASISTDTDGNDATISSLVECLAGGMGPDPECTVLAVTAFEGDLQIGTATGVPGGTAMRLEVTVDGIISGMCTWSLEVWTDDPGSNPSAVKLIDLDDGSGAVPLNASASVQAGQTLYVDFDPMLAATNTPGFCESTSHEVRFTAVVPEPCAAALLALGSGILPALRRRRRRS